MLRCSHLLPWYFGKLLLSQCFFRQHVFLAYQCLYILFLFLVSETRSYYVSQIGLQIIILHSQSLECWNYAHVLHTHFLVVSIVFFCFRRGFSILRIVLGAMLMICVLGHRATSPHPWQAFLREGNKVGKHNSRLWF